MLGQSQLDLAKNLTDERRGSDEHIATPHNDGVADRIRLWTGQRLITFGERLSARPTDLQLTVSTGPPCP